MSESIVSLITLITSFFSSVGSGTCRDCPVNLLINGQNDPPGIVLLQDLKPGDQREVPKDLFADCKNPAKIYLHLKDLTPSQGLQTEPEQLEEHGLPKFDLPKYIDYDLRLGDQIIIAASDHILFSDVVSCWIPIGIIPPQTHIPLYQSFHFDKNVTNWAQGDTTTFTEEFLAIDAASTHVPDTGTGRVWDPTLKKCVPGPTTTPKPSPTLKPTSTPTPTPPPTPLACQHIQFSGPPIVGTSGNDNLPGTPGNDLIFGREGRDHIEGNSGDDCLVGGPGNDRLNGNNGQDAILGEAGNDRLFGNNQDDYLDGGPGTDRADGNAGTDTCTAEIESHCEL